MAQLEDGIPHVLAFHSDAIERSDCTITQGHILESAGPRLPMVLHHVEVVAQQLEDEDGESTGVMAIVTLRDVKGGEFLSVCDSGDEDSEGEYDEEEEESGEEGSGEDEEGSEEDEEAF